MRYATIAVVAVAVGFCVGSLRSNEEQVVPGSDPDHPLEVLYVRELMVVDNQGLPRIKLRQTDKASVVAVIGPHNIEEELTLSVLDSFGSHVSLRDRDGQPRGGLHFAPGQEYTHFLGTVVPRP